jgi:hypothetical protein
LAGPTILIQPGVPLDPQLVAFLGHSSGSVDQLVVISNTDLAAAAIDSTIAQVVSGPLGYSSGPLAPIQ